MGFDDLCNTGLILGLGFSPPTSKRSPPQKLRRISNEPSLTLSLSGDHDRRQDSGGSSFSSSLKREREEAIVEIPDEQRGEEDGNNDEDEDNRRKKKLRLSRAQSALLEESFMLHTTLNPKQKQELARQLKLRPRQVEVWFQNRRARTKLKQTEVECEFLKKCCEALTDENRRLHKELKALKLGEPLRTHDVPFL